MSWNGLSVTAAVEAAGARRSGAALGLQQTFLGVAIAVTPLVFAPFVAATSWRVGFAVAAAVPVRGVGRAAPARAVRLSRAGSLEGGGPAYRSAVANAAWPPDRTGSPCVTSTRSTGWSSSGRSVSAAVGAASPSHAARQAEPPSRPRITSPVTSAACAASR